MGFSRQEYWSGLPSLLQRGELGTQKGASVKGHVHVQEAGEWRPPWRRSLDDDLLETGCGVLGTLSGGGVVTHTRPPGAAALCIWGAGDISAHASGPGQCCSARPARSSRHPGSGHLASDQPRACATGHGRCGGRAAGAWERPRAPDGWASTGSWPPSAVAALTVFGGLLSTETWCGEASWRGRPPCVCSS